MTQFPPALRVRLPDDLRAWAEAEARRQGGVGSRPGIGAIIRRALSEYRDHVENQRANELKRE